MRVDVGLEALVLVLLICTLCYGEPLFRVSEALDRFFKDIDPSSVVVTQQQSTPLVIRRTELNSQVFFKFTPQRNQGTTLYIANFIPENSELRTYLEFWHGFQEAQPIAVWIQRLPGHTPQIHSFALLKSEHIADLKHLLHPVSVDRTRLHLLREPLPSNS